ncbi:UNVERIFIED_CONTAM: putative pentatricopeptide repeat-containing protein, mitochondrial [Sesamum calycinum]|uniref:Pentatricopeptide repeat-containing protein, mitochondrial n=1 Tax=Sesamum calycinum TaxID=2727403 RepID=A0AAW2RAI9_9LAMI
MGGIAAASAIHLIRRGISANKLGTSSLPFSFFSSNFHSIGHKDGTFSPKPRIDFSCIHEVDDAVSLFRQMLRMRPKPTDVDFNRLLTAVVKVKQYSVALNLFDEMHQLGTPVSEYTLTIVINCYCLLNRVDFGFAILGSFFKRGYEPNVTTFTTLIKGLFLDDNVIEAEKLFKKLLALRLCEPNEVTILTVINGLCKAGHTLTAYDLLGLFEKTSFKPNVYSYSTVIDSLCKDRMVDEALQLIAKMIDKGISPNINVQFNASRLVQFRKELVKEAENVVEIMMQRNIPPDTVTCNALIDGYSLVGQIDKARKLLDSMPGRGLKPSIISYNSLINGYCKKGKVEEAWRLFLKVPHKGLGYDVVTYNTMLHGLFCAGRFADGLKHFKDMQAEQVIPNLVTYCTLLHGLCMNKQIADAFSFLHIMEEKGVNPDITTYSILIHGLCKDGKLEIARDVFNSLPCKGVLRRKLLVEAKTFLDEMYRRGFSPDATSASMLLDHLQDTDRASASDLLSSERQEWVLQLSQREGNTVIDPDVHSGRRTANVGVHWPDFRSCVSSAKNFKNRI